MMSSQLWLEKSGLINKNQKPLKWNIYFPGTVDKDVQKWGVNKEEAVSWWWNLLGEHFLRVRTKKILFRGCQGFISSWQSNLDMCKNFSSGNGFERMKGSWTTADTWHSESPLVKRHLHLLWVNQLLNMIWRGHNETAGEKLVKDQPEETLVY